MSENRQTRGGFFSWMFPDTPDDERTAVYTSEEVGLEETAEASRGFTVERAAEVIDNLPPEVPRSSAVRIVRGTLEAAGIDIGDLAASTRAREEKLNSEIEGSRDRIQELRDTTEQTIRSLEEEIRRAREARDSGVAEEEKRISDARAGLAEVERVREFFSLQRGGTAEPADITGEKTQAMEPVDEDDTQILRRPGPLSEGYWGTEENRDR